MTQPTEKMVEAFMVVARGLEGLSPQQALEVLAMASGRLIASVCAEEDKRTAAFTHLGKAVECYMTDYLPYADGYRKFTDAMPNADTIKN